MNATGVWTDEVQDLAGRGRIHVRASKGIHLVVPRDRIAGDVGLIIPTENSVLFVIPWRQHWIIGTTDTEWNLDLAHPAASARDVDYLLETLNRLLVEPLTRSDIEGIYAGLRPLLAEESDATSRLSREHAVSESVSGLITVAGGKYTTYRIMARDAIDLAASQLPKKVTACCTDRTLLLGAEGYWGCWNRRHEAARASGLHVGQVEHLLSRYGSETSELLRLIEERASRCLASTALNHLSPSAGPLKPVTSRHILLTAVTFPLSSTAHSPNWKCSERASSRVSSKAN